MSFAPGYRGTDVIMKEYLSNKKQSIMEIANTPQGNTTVSMPPENELTFGMKLVGIGFNPSGDEKVNKVKDLCAQLADIAYENWCRDAYSEKSNLENLLYQHTIGEILNAQMNIVKLLTLKY